MRTKRRRSHRYSILATDVRLLCAKYKKVVKKGMETDRMTTLKVLKEWRSYRVEYNQEAFFYKILNCFLMADKATIQ